MCTVSTTSFSEVSDTNCGFNLLNFLSSAFIDGWSDEQYLLAITDLDGKIIKSSGYDNLADYLVTGFKWSEENVGLNALVLAMKTGTLSYINFEKHTNSKLKDHYTIAAPIYQEDNTRIAYLLMAGKIDAEFNLALTIFKFFIKQLELHLQELLAYGELCSTVSDGVIAIDAGEVIVYANDAALELMGLNTQGNDHQLVGKRLTNFLETRMEITPAFIFEKKIINKETTVKIINRAKVYHVTSTVLPQYDYSGVQCGTLIILKKMKEVVSEKVQGQELTSNYKMLDIVYQSRAMDEMIKMAEIAAQGPLSVLIQGESGTGKELLANAIHNVSNFRDGPFVIVDCATIPRELVESELFGYVEGSFTGAIRGGKTGKFQLANGGTIFLDEIGEMPLEMQAKLLRVLQSHQITKVGSSSPIFVNIRIIAATNKDLLREVKNNRFREDLFYRLDVMELNIPPLRERIGDIPLLANYFVEKYQCLFNKQGLIIQPDAMDLLCKYVWPGNVRELENVIARAVNLCMGKTILSSNLPQRFKRYEGEEVSTLYYSSDDIEKNNILKALKTHNGNKSEAARGLKICRSTLYKKMKEYRIAD